MLSDESPEYNTYMAKLRVFNAEDCVHLSRREGGYVFDKLSFSYPMQKLSIPDFVVKLGDGCCSGTLIEVVTLGRNVKKIGYGCFANCNNLREIRIHKGQEAMIDELKVSNSATIKIID